MLVNDEARAERDDYSRWLEAARPALEQRRWKDAFAGPPRYPYASATTTVWTPLDIPLAKARVGLVSSAGFYIPHTQCPFDAGNIEGDTSFRLIPADVASEQTAIAHEHYDHAGANRDRNTVFPVDRLQELEGAGVIGELHREVVSFSGYATRQWEVRDRLALAISDAFNAADVDVALLVPV